MSQPDDWTEDEAFEAQAFGRIAELEHGLSNLINAASKIGFPLVSNQSHLEVGDLHVVIKESKKLINGSQGNE